MCLKFLAMKSVCKEYIDLLTLRTEILFIKQCPLKLMPGNK